MKLVHPASARRQEEKQEKRDKAMRTVSEGEEPKQRLEKETEVEWGMTR
jgi:hypothetical protein